MPIKPKQSSASSTSSISSSSSPLASATSDLWEDVSTHLTRRCVCLEIYGDTDTGKSTLALTAPGPIAYIHAHEKIEGIIQSARRKKDIRACKFGGVFRGNPDEVQALANASVQRMENAMSDAYRWARTIILDTHTECWQVYQLARLGSLTRSDRNEKDNRMGQLVYTEINNRWQSMLKEFRIRQEEPLQDKPTNLILIGQTKDEYRKSTNTGKTESTGRTIEAGQKGVKFFCDLIIRTKFNKREDKFSALIEKPWYNGEVRGEEIEQEFMTFPQILGLVTEVDPEEWE